MYLLILLLPFISFLFSLNKKLARKGVYFSIFNMTCVFILSNICFYEVCICETGVILNLFNWVNILYININMCLYFDTLTVSMFIPVITISLFVQIYSLGYMENDPHLSRFFSYLNIFTFFMLILITGENLLVLFLGWEGVGLASYLLINFWYTRIAANMASFKAFFINRIGDMSITICMCLILCYLSTLSLYEIFTLCNYINGDILFILLILLLIGAMAKSAQVPLHSWLADAMEGPTPVSALIHAATMVTAGVYLLMRTSPILEYSNTILLIITWIGGISALTGAISGLMQNDLKKVIAFSTTSQLGYMVISCGTSQYTLALFHLINHAMFKALLFMSAGSIIHAMMDNQDMRRYGSLIKYLPISYIYILSASLSLMAFPFMTGFYSKDFIIEICCIPYNLSLSVAYILALVSAIITSLYSCRLLIYTFISSPRFPYSITRYILEPNIYMLFPKTLLFVFSIIWGYITHNLFLGIGSIIYKNSLFIHPCHLSILNGSLSDISFIKYLPLASLLIIFSIFPKISYKSFKYVYNNVTLHNVKFINIYHISYHTNILNYFNNFIYYILYISLIFSNYLFRYFDRGYIELLGPMGCIQFVSYISFNIYLLDSAFILHVIMNICLFILLTYIIYIYAHYIMIPLSLISFILFIFIIQFLFIFYVIL